MEATEAQAAGPAGSRGRGQAGESDHPVSLGWDKRPRAVSRHAGGQTGGPGSVLGPRGQAEGSDSQNSKCLLGQGGPEICASPRPHHRHLQIPSRCVWFGKKLGTGSWGPHLGLSFPMGNLCAWKEMGLRCIWERQQGLTRQRGTGRWDGRSVGVTSHRGWDKVGSWPSHLLGASLGRGRVSHMPYCMAGFWGPWLSSFWGNPFLR